MKVEELLNEGPLDYLKGMGQHLGGKFVDKMAQKGKQIAQPFIDANDAGRRASREGDLRSQKAKQAKLAQQEQDRKTKDEALLQRAQAAIQPTIQELGPLMLNIYKLEQGQQAPTNEGLYDYLRGAGKAVGGAARNVGQSVRGAAQQAGQAVRGAAQQAGQAVGGAVRDINQQGQQASQLGNLKNQKQQLIKRLCKIAGVVGPDIVIKAMSKMYAQKQINLYNKMKKEFLAACQSTR